MSIYKDIEDGAFNELVNYEFSELTKILGEYEYYVTKENIVKFVNEVSTIQNEHLYQKKEIEKYANDFENLVQKNIHICYEDEPSYKYDILYSQTRDKLIKKIEKYFDYDTFEKNKNYLEASNEKSISVETPLDLSLTLLIDNKRMYSLLSIIGFYQRRKHYFLSNTDWNKINFKYSNEIYKLNKDLGMEWRYWNIFASWGRINSEEYSKYGFIDIDKISLYELIAPYFKTNTKELNQMIEIAMKVFRTSFLYENPWKEVQKQCDVFIKECEEKGLMKVL